MHSKVSRWSAKPPGSYNELNTEHYKPELTDKGYPIIPAYDGSIPDRFYRFRGSPIGDAECMHFYLDDYRFQCLWNKPEYYAEKFKNLTVLSPDFSLYSDWPSPIQMFNHYRKQWIGAYFSDMEINIIPTISWSDAQSYDWCFDGIMRNSIVSISTTGCKKFIDPFSEGFDEMMNILEPKIVLCCGKQLGTMKNYDNIIYYDVKFKTHSYERVN